VPVADLADGGDTAPEDDTAPGDDTAPEAAELLHKMLGNGSESQNLVPHLMLQARCRIFTPDEAMRRDFASSLTHGKRKRDPQLDLDPGMKLECVAQLGKLLLGGGYRRPRQLVEERVDLPQRLVDIANRETLKQPEEGDESVLAQLRSFKNTLSIDGKGSTFLELLRAASKAIGMELDATKHQPQQSDGTRPRLVQSMHLKRLVPAVSDAWLVRSNQLGKLVRVGDWSLAHAAAQAAAVEQAYASDCDYGDLFTAPFDADSDDVRYEKTNDADLQKELTRLRRIKNTLHGQTRTPSIEQDLRRLAVLEAIDGAAEPEVSGIRRLCVVYGKRRSIGRRTASYPSMQSCPSALRPLLQRLSTTTSTS